MNCFVLLLQMLEKVQASVSGIEDKLMANIQASVCGMATEVSQLEARLSFLEGQALNQYTCMVRS